jgi:tetratricopeptide (TPR) repeat protein
LSEDAFERIIDYYDDLDDLAGAIDAADTGIGQHPYSSTLLIKKADLLISAKRYDEAHELLDRAEILDSNDIDIYILRTDAYLAQDLQERAVSLLEEAIHRFDGEDRIDLLFDLTTDRPDGCFDVKRIACPGGGAARCHVDQHKREHVLRPLFDGRRPGQDLV